MLELKNVRRCYGELVAVDDLSITIKPGEIFALLGPNGAGKTTAFRMITGLLNPNKGTINYNNESIGYHISDEVGFLIEERALLPKLKVRELLHFFGRLKNMEPKNIDEKMDYWLKFFNVEEYRGKVIKELSKGNQQKIQFISAIINDPKLLILDEPFSGLDPMNIEKMIQAIRMFQEQGTIILFSTHRIDHVEMFCEQLVVLHKGKTILSGKIDQIKDDFKRKTIYLKGNASEKELREIKGVRSVVKNANEFVISIESVEFASNVFDYIKKLDIVEKYVVAKPSLQEIFVEKVGMAYDA